MNVIGENVFQPFQLFIPIGFICRPESGSMLMYSRKKVRYRRDGYCWKKRKDGKTTREDHMKLKVQGVEVSVFEKCFFLSLFSKTLRFVKFH